MMAKCGLATLGRREHVHARGLSVPLQSVPERCFPPALLLPRFQPVRLGDRADTWMLPGRDCLCPRLLRDLWNDRRLSNCGHLLRSRYHQHQMPSKKNGGGVLAPPWVMTVLLLGR
jgi:hypothetical protein